MVLRDSKLYLNDVIKAISNKIKILFPDIEWEAIVGMRNVIAHEYFGIDLKIIWKTIRTKLTDLKNNLKKLK